MPPKICRIPGENRLAFLKNLIKKELHDKYHYLAIALSEGLGWPLIGLFKDGRIVHVGVRSPKGEFRDVRGAISEEEFGKPFGLTPPYESREVYPYELVPDNFPDHFDFKVLREHWVGAVRRIAEMLWPDLPWKDSFAKRVKTFAQELEALSRKHGIWISDSTREGLPVLDECIGKKVDGYELVPTPDCMTFTITSLKKYDLGTL